jgi:hypothetical protein
MAGKAGVGALAAVGNVSCSFARILRPASYGQENTNDKQDADSTR